MRSNICSWAFSIIFFGMIPLAQATSPDSRFPVPYEQKFTRVDGITWLHLNGRPMARRYIIEPGSRKYCTFELSKESCSGRPCESETLIYLKLSYFDPSMNEDRGVVTQYVELNPAEIEGNMFEPKPKWTSISSGGKVRTVVSYDEDEHSTSFYQERKFMIYNYTWAKIITNEAHDQILSVRMSHDTNKNSREDERWTVLECVSGS